MRANTSLAALLYLAACGASALAADSVPMAQGLHQWPAADGKLMLVVGTRQDSVSFKRTYNFYFKEAKEEAWNQVTVRDKNGLGQAAWHSATGAEVTLADGVVTARPDGVYFIVADKRVQGAYQERGDITVTWYKLTLSADDRPDDPPYQLVPGFQRQYPKSAATIEALLKKELTLQPRK